MKFLEISSRTTLADLSNVVGRNNVEDVLHLNGLDRIPRVGKQYHDRCNQINAAHVQALENTSDTSYKDTLWKRRLSILNTFVDDSDVFEYACMLDDSDWGMLLQYNTFPGMIKVPNSVIIADSVKVLGNGQAVPKRIYDDAMKCVTQLPHVVDPKIFNEYSDMQPVINPQVSSTSNIMKWFKIPWGDVLLYSSLSGDYINLPGYPEELSKSIKAEYTTMPDMLYQYEPWYVYKSSGPRQEVYTFDFHRDMWTGNHLDGKANEMIRFCEANCYPRYDGSSVNTSIVTLYIKGRVMISGILTEVNVDWDGPIGQDGYYLHGKMSLHITEISDKPLNYDSVRSKPLIG